MLNSSTAYCLYPNGIQMVRVALEGITFPAGGGSDGKQPE